MNSLRSSHNFESIRWSNNIVTLILPHLVVYFGEHVDVNNVLIVIKIYSNRSVDGR